jgi:hypothetical protein
MASSFDHGRGALRIHAVVVVTGLRCDATEASAASDVLRGAWNLYGATTDAA